MASKVKRSWTVFVSACVLAALTLAPSYLQETGNYEHETNQLYRYILLQEGKSGGSGSVYFDRTSPAGFYQAALNDLGESERGGLNAIDRLRLVDLWLLSYRTTARVIHLSDTRGMSGQIVSHPPQEAPSPLPELRRDLGLMVAGVLAHEDVQLKLFKFLPRGVQWIGFEQSLMRVFAKYVENCAKEGKPVIIFSQVREDVARIANTTIITWGGYATQDADEKKRFIRMRLRLLLARVDGDDRDKKVVVRDLVDRKAETLRGIQLPEIKIVRSHGSRTQRIKGLVRSASFSRVACEGLFW